MFICNISVYVINCVKICWEPFYLKEKIVRNARYFFKSSYPSIVHRNGPHTFKALRAKKQLAIRLRQLASLAV